MSSFIALLLMYYLGNRQQLLANALMNRVSPFWATAIRNSMSVVVLAAIVVGNNYPMPGGPLVFTAGLIGWVLVASYLTKMAYDNPVVKKVIEDSEKKIEGEDEEP